MTEIPEHLLRRSKERRAALSGEEAPGGDAPSGPEGGTAPRPEGGTATAEAAAAVAEPTAGSAPVPAGGSAPATAVGGGGAAAPRTGVPTVAEAPEAPRLGPQRTKVPFWVLPILLALPVWGVIYLGAFGARNVNSNDPVTLGGTLFAQNCSSCHGANGEGGVGPQLNSGEVIKEWPNIADHIKWVHTGGAPYIGGTIGALHIPVPANNVMPAFGQDHGGTLSDLQIQQVVCYERVSFGAEAESAKNCPGFAG